MGMSTILAIWQSYVNASHRSISDRSKYLGVMDDLFSHSSDHNHLKYFKYLLKALFKCGLKISPRKCQLFRTKWQYMGNNIFIKEKGSV